MKKWLDKIKPNKNKIYIMPTSFGIYFLVIIFVLFLISLGYGHSLSLTATFVFVSFVLASAHATNFNLSHINILKISVIRECYEGADLLIEVVIENAGQKERFGIESAVYERTNKSSFIDIGPGEVGKIQLAISDLSRGKYVFQKIKLISEFPFGLFQSWKVLEAKLECYIFPERKSFIKLANINVAGLQRDDGRIGTVPGVEDFDGHKRFVESDSWKNIDWKAYSRNGILSVKQFNDPATGKLLLSYQELLKLKTEERLSQLAYWAELCFSKNYEFAIELPESPVSYGSGVQHYRSEMQKLSSFEREISFV